MYDDLAKGMIQDSRKYSVEKLISTTGLPDFDEDLPGGGRFYCAETARHFISQAALDGHKKTKMFKKRCKELKIKPYTQEDADRAGGITKETYAPIVR